MDRGAALIEEGGAVEGSRGPVPPRVLGRGWLAADLGMRLRAPFGEGDRAALGSVLVRGDLRIGFDPSA